MEQIKDECIIYGVDTCATVTPPMVRDALISCFKEAHAKELEDLRSYVNVTDEEFEKMKEMDVKTLIVTYFAQTGGDFENPTKASMMAVIEKLADFAKNFRDQKVVAAHYENIMKLINCIKE